MILLGDEGDGAVDSSRRPCLHFEPIPPERSEVAHVTKCDETVTIVRWQPKLMSERWRNGAKAALGAGDCGGSLPGRVDVVSILKR